MEDGIQESKEQKEFRQRQRSANIQDMEERIDFIRSVEERLNSIAEEHPYQHSSLQEYIEELGRKEEELTAIVTEERYEIAREENRDRVFGEG